MTSKSARTSPDRILSNDAELKDLLGLLFQGATCRQLWMVFIGEDGRVAGPLLPMSDHPRTPEELCDTLDLGTVPFAEVLIDRAASVCEMIGDVSVVFVRERPGPPGPSALDLRWARALAREADRAGVPIRAQFVLHSEGIRQFSVAELQDPVAAEAGEMEAA